MLLYRALTVWTLGEGSPVVGAAMLEKRTNLCNQY